MRGLLGKIALITGASSGIGAAIAKNFVASAAHVILTGRNKDALTSVQKYCSKLSKDVSTVIIAGDLTSVEEIKKIAEFAMVQHDRLDVLVNNAGILELGSIENTSLEQLDRVLNIILRAMYELTRLLTSRLVESKGNIVNVSSVNGLRAFSGLQAYNISKAAVDQFTRSAALELASKGVRVNCVNLGVVVTELQKRGGLSDNQYQKFLEHSCETHALGRPGRPEEVANAVSFLADNSLSSFITGATLPVDGGRHAMCPR